MSCLPKNMARRSRALLRARTPRSEYTDTRARTAARARGKTGFYTPPVLTRQPGAVENAAYPRRPALRRE